MKKITLLIPLTLLLLAGNAQAQVLYNNGATLFINTGATVKVNGDATNKASSTLTNNGTLTVMGNVTNDEVMATPNNGILKFNGTAAQSLNGAAGYYAKDVLVNNAAGVTLNAPLKVDGSFNFTDGIVTAATTANAVTFTNNGTVSSTPTDASHVNGFVVKEGTGSFAYPVGDAAKYQPVDADLSYNTSGMQVKYIAADAGTAPFGTTGTETTPLTSYNTNEYWDMHPLDNANGTVTIYWDGYNDSRTDFVSQRRVAHKFAGNTWLNEGTSNGTGTITAGSVTSNALTSWSPVTLGIITVPLAVKWINTSAQLKNNSDAIINWIVEEQHVSGYLVQRSTNGNNFITIGSLSSKGDGSNSYAFTDAQPVDGVYYYRILQTNANGSISYSTIVSVQKNGASTVSIYPNPAKDVVTLRLSNDKLLNTTAKLFAANGELVREIRITNLQQPINVNNLAAGIYLLRLQNGGTLQMIKK